MADYKDTLNLPKTDFEMRAGLAQKEPKQLAAWEARGLYEEVQRARAGRPRYVLHDGPPYANGQIHHGHILNKVLKDIVVKDRTMAGFQAPYIPGWDCHGLPIEVQVDKELGPKKQGMSKVEIRAACRAYAEKFVGIQRQQFQRLGVFGRWQDPYLTMSHGYEAQIIRELATLAANGLLYKGLRPVNWCLTHQTALAEAEVEYEDHTSPSVYVAFKVVEGFDGDVVIWTTTPWTLPANLAVSVHPDFDYVAYPIRGRNRIFARELAGPFLAAVGEPAFDPSRVVKSWKGRELEGLVYEHPFMGRRSKVILGEHVTLEAGTGCVHTAPGHGAEDFDVGKRYGLEVLSPVDGRGVFTKEGGPFAGKKVWDANPEIVALLVEKGVLLSDPKAKVTHRYAHCWRCHNPIILRATEQWWLSMDKPYAGGGTLRERVMDSLADVEWIPSWGVKRIGGMLAGRPDWCLSRQRVWGVPIPVVYCEGCGKPHVDPAGMQKVADRFESEGSDAWYVRSVEELLGPVKCAGCGGAKFRKEEDILDVWFDSGVSYAAVIEREKLGHPDGAPIDLYLEGSDQHRGWFHTSLLCSMGTRRRAPFRTVLTHGFIVDGEGKKISKSKGNFVDPFKVIDQHGAELWRLWVAAEDYREDVRLSDEILKRLTETYRKVRNTMRYLLGSLSDFVPERDAAKALLPLDRWAVALILRDGERLASAYRSATFHQAVGVLNELCTVDLSAFYLDVLKDRMYCSKADSPARRSAQTAVYIVTRDLLRLAAPILCFTAEEAWKHLPKLPGDPDSVHLALYPGADPKEAFGELRRSVAGEAEALLARYAAARTLREKVNAALEGARRDKLIGSSAEARVKLSVEDAQGFSAAELADICIVSELELAKGAFAVEVSRASGTKCARCWLYRHDVGRSREHADVCARCAEALSK
jgi:isoleucyl-tRNA synthetase